MHQQAVHHVPQVLGGERVLPEQHRAQLGRDEVRAGRPERPREPAHAIIGLDGQEKRLDLERVLVDLAAVLGEMLLLAERRIDVDRPHQPLLPERPLGRHRAADLTDPHAVIFTFASPARSPRPDPSRTGDREQAGAGPKVRPRVDAALSR